ncbi:MAG: 1-deoxy-D-xylulose-5-phosphate reductoisomerase [Deltaproteobacteria bacterium HGW-Deltaproteobacteria-12]|jgi:1-deoxy-D-xylulose-5-phosphate reductoisomerase|nr:MAG: 1-deoxy-D-xylulose-5-phosphate reductoisomerase [Deltaproteobacteria bacterium HGW-Deltaproteobacteria-12]
MKNITVLGSTGSIGVSALDVIDKNPGRFRVVALAAGKNIQLLQKQIEKFRPQIVAVNDVQCASKLRNKIPVKIKTRIVSHEEGLKEVSAFAGADIVLSAISGAAGLIPTLAAIDAGKDIALANKETMVMAGDIVTKKAREKGVQIIPVDSEHSAIFQCLQGQKRENVKKIILTASGGPFLNYKIRELKKVTLRQALKHPRWKMGRKITVDSASLMNKGLEVIEAKWLFNLEMKKIDVLIHPQSIVHSMVEFIDGSLLAQMGIPDMRTPIAYALTYPERININLPILDLVKTRNLEFYKPDTRKFPCLRLAYEAGVCGGTMPAVLNAANEIAVEAFLKEIINFVDFPGIIDKVLSRHNSIKDPSLEDILKADEWARARTKEMIERIAS